MFKQQVVSVTDLRMKTKQSLHDLKRGPKFVFSNNSPVAVLMDVEEYEMLIRPDLFELSNEEMTDVTRSAAQEARHTPKEELLNI